MLKRCLKVWFLSILLIPASQSGFVPDFVAQQSGGANIQFKLADHRGAWVLIFFLPGGENEPDREVYLDYENNLDRLIYGHNVKPIFFKPDGEDFIAQWWEELPSNRIPVFRDPKSELARTLKIPLGLRTEAGISNYPAAILVDPAGDEVFRRVGKRIDDRLFVEEFLQKWKELETTSVEKDPVDDIPAGDWIVSETGLKYHDLVSGEGPMPARGNVLVVHYTGRLEESGKKFDSSLDREQPFTFTFQVSKMIKGWTEGMATMRVGGKRLLKIPPDLAYGKGGSPPKIPPDATLIFEIELLEIR